MERFLIIGELISIISQQSISSDAELPRVTGQSPRLHRPGYCLSQEIADDPNDECRQSALDFIAEFEALRQRVEAKLRGE